MESAVGCPAMRPPRPCSARCAKAACSAALLLALAGGAQADVVYRWVDADGLPVFSDAPPAGAAAVPLPQGPVNVYAVRPTSARAPNGTADDEAGPEDEGYAAARIVAPVAGATVRANGGAVTLRGQVSPPLRDGHRAVLFLDGAPLGEAAGTGDAAVEFTLANVARGRHRVHIEVVGHNGDTLLRGAPSVFHVQRVALGR